MAIYLWESVLRAIFVRIQCCRFSTQRIGGKGKAIPGMWWIFGCWLYLPPTHQGRWNSKVYHSLYRMLTEPIQTNPATLWLPTHCQPLQCPPGSWGKYSSSVLVTSYRLSYCDKINLSLNIIYMSMERLPQNYIAQKPRSQAVCIEIGKLVTQWPCIPLPPITRAWPQVYVAEGHSRGHTPSHSLRPW